MAIQKVINHIYNCSDYDIEHAQTSSDMVLHNNSNLLEFLKTMFPNTGGTITGHVFMQNNLDVYGYSGFKNNMYLDKKLIIKDFNNSQSEGCYIYLNNNSLNFDNLQELRANSFKASELGFYQEFSDGSSVRMDGRGGSGSSYGLGWYFSNAKGTFIDLYAKNVQNQSDARVKDIIPVNEKNKTIAENAVENITPKKFKYFNDDKIRYGFIAQEIEKYIPEAVFTSNFSIEEAEIPIDKFGNKIYDCKFIDPTALIATLWQEVKVLQEEIKVLKGK